VALKVYWFLPSHGDGRQIAKRPAGELARAAPPRREPDAGYLAQVAAAADQLGFHGALLPAGLFCEDPWLVSAALAHQTHDLRFMVALRPGLISPTLVAQMAATAQRVTGGRLQLNVVVGGDPDEQHRYGDWLDHDQRYDRAEEFLSVLRRVWSGETVDFDGAHYRLAGARVARPAAQTPTVFLGGSSPQARRAAARYADVYLAWGESPESMAPMLDDMRRLAREEGRDVELGTRFHVIARDTAEEAWAEARRLVDGMDPAQVEAAQRRFRATESHGQRRMAALHGGGLDRLEIHPNVWAGYTLLRPGAGVALVGSHAEVAARIEEFHAMGIEHLILSGQPHLEEAYWFGEGVLPLLAQAPQPVGR
jgi:alkanesulfonate monooxygenase